MIAHKTQIGFEELITFWLGLLLLWLLMSGCTKDFGDAGGPFIPPPPPPFRTIDTEPDWSPDGKTIAYTHLPQDSSEFVNGRYQIWLLDPETISKRFLTTGFLPAWSPDGRKIAYVNKNDIQITRLTSWGSCFSPNWSPDGTKIAYDATTNWPTVPVDSAGIWIINLKDFSKKQVVRFNGGMPEWSPDSQKMVFVQAIANEAPYDEISIIALQDSTVVRLTNNSFDDRDPAWSPNGSEIAWGSYAGANPSSGVWVMNADGTDQRQLTRGGGYPSWSPDGRQIVYYQANEDGRTGTLWLMNADGSNQRQLTKP